MWRMGVIKEVIVVFINGFLMRIKVEFLIDFCNGEKLIIVDDFLGVLMNLKDIK